MTGPEHYTEAERILEDLRSGSTRFSYWTAADVIAMAQVHASLALAAASKGERLTYPEVAS